MQNEYFTNIKEKDSKTAEKADRYSCTLIKAQTEYYATIACFNVDLLMRKSQSNFISSDQKT